MNTKPSITKIRIALSLVIRDIERKLDNYDSSRRITLDKADIELWLNALEEIKKETNEK